MPAAIRAFPHNALRIRVACYVFQHLLPHYINRCPCPSWRVFFPQFTVSASPSQSSNLQKVRSLGLLFVLHTSERPDRTDTSIVCSPPFNTEISGVLVSVFSMENDWRQAHVPLPLILLATIWTLAFLPPGACHERHQPRSHSARSNQSLEVCRKLQATQENDGLAIHPLVPTLLPLHQSTHEKTTKGWGLHPSASVCFGGLQHLVQTKNSAFLDEYLETLPRAFA